MGGRTDIQGRLLVAAVAVAGLLLTVAYAHRSRSVAVLESEAQFQVQAGHHEGHIQQHLAARLQSLQDLGRFVGLAGPPTRETFLGLAQAELDRAPGILALAWVPRVAATGRAAVEARLRAAGAPGITVLGRDGQLRGAPEGPEHFVVLEVAGLQGRIPALGLDLGSEPQRRRMIETARDTGRTRATAPLELVKEVGARAGVLVAVPVYARQRPAAAVAERRAAFLGVVLGVFRAPDLVAAALPKDPEDGVRGEMVDAEAPGGPAPLHTWGGEPARLPATLASRFLQGTLPAEVSTLDFGGRTWRTTFRPSVAWAGLQAKTGAWHALGAGLLITLLSAFGVHRLLGQKTRAERLFLERNAELLDSLARLRNREDDLRLLLDSTAEAIYGVDLEGRCTFCNRVLLDRLGLASDREVVGRPMHEFLHHTGPQWRTQQAGEDGIGRATLEGRVVHADDEAVLLRDGTTLPVECWSHPQWRDGAVVGAVVSFLDISDRRRRDMELGRRQAQVQNLLDSIPDIVFFKDLQGRYLGCNPPFLELVGRTRQEVLGRVDSDIFDPHSAMMFRTQDLRVLEAMRTRHLEEWITYPDGREVLVDTLKTPYLGPSGELLGILGISRDITERKQMEEAILSKDRLLDAVSRGLVDLLDASDWSLGLPKFLATLGEGTGVSRVYVFRGVPGRNREIRANLIGEWCRPGVPSALGDPELQQVPLRDAGYGRWLDELTQGHLFTGHTRDLPEGERAHLEENGIQSFLMVPIHVQGGLWGIIGVNECSGLRVWSRAEQDIFRLSARGLGTAYERHEAFKAVQAARADLEIRVEWRTEELLRVNRNLKEEMAIRLQAERRFAAITHGFLRLGPVAQANLEVLAGLLGTLAEADGAYYLGVKGAGLEVTCGLPVPLDPPAALLEMDPSALPPARSMELQSGPDGTRTVLVQGVWAEDRVVGALAAVRPASRPWTGEERAVLGIIAAAAGTEERRLQAENRSHFALVQLAQAQKLESVGRLAAGIAHEINTPIQFLSMNLRFLQKTYQQLLDAVAGIPALARDLEWIQEETPKVIDDSMEGIERVARIVRAMKEFSHPGTPDPVTVDINKCLESAATVSRNEWKYNATLVMELEPGLPLIQGYPAELNQVFLNLIVNAAHAITARRNPEGELGTITLSTATLGDGVEIRVRDTGTGIAPEHQAKVFDPFFTTKDVGVGTGQGLTVSYQTVVHMHGGRIRFETEQGLGTQFVVELPGMATPGRPWAGQQGVA